MALVTVPEIQVLDPYYYKVVLLLSGNGPNGSTAFKDNGLPNNPVTPYGNAQISTAQSKFGGSSMYFDGAGDWLQVPTNAAFEFGSGDFTIEFWAYLLNTTTEQFLVCARDVSASIYNNAIRVKAGKLGWSNGTAWNETANSVPVNTWCHMAAVRYSQTFLLFIGGMLGYSGVQPVNITGPRPIYVGASDDPAYRYAAAGYIDDLRITKGVALYTDNFTPPAAEFPWLDTSALGARAFNANVARRICAPAGALAPGGPVTAAFDNNLAQRNTYFGGTGQITGTVKEKNLPTNVPLHRRVCLLEEKTRLLVAEAWSDAVTGNYLFDRIDPTRTYTVMAYDHTGLYRAVIADRIVPEMLP